MRAGRWRWVAPAITGLMAASLLPQPSTNDGSTPTTGARPDRGTATELEPVTLAVGDRPEAADAGLLATTLIPNANRFPDGPEDQRAIVRDCGFSAPLPSGQSLWVFCDTVLYDGIHGAAPDFDATTRVIHSGTAALAPIRTDPSPSQPVQLHEAAFPDLPRRFITPSGQHGPPEDRQPITCPPGIVPFAWTKGMVTLPGTSTVVAFFQEHCPDLTSGFAEFDIGVAEIDVATTGPDDLAGAATLDVDRRFDSVLVNPDPGSSRKWGYGTGPVIHGDHLYVYNARPQRLSCTATSCTELEPGAVRVARVRWTDGSYRSGDAYEYYTGSSVTPWSADPNDAVDVLPDRLWPSGDGMSVAWYPELDRYVMTHSATRISPTSGMAIRTAVTPWGPWSAPVDVTIDAASSLANPAGGCSDPTPCRTFVLHPELTPAGGDTLYLSYVRKQDHATLDGQIATFAGRNQFRVRLAGLPLSALPPAAPETTLVGFPVDATAQTSATFHFRGEGRPSTGGDPAVPSDAEGFRCSLDGGPAAPCTSPTTVTGLADGVHTFTVAAIDGSGASDPTPATRTWSVDRGAPSTSVTNGPASPSSPDGSTFRFAGTDDQTTADALGFECALDGDAWSTCSASWVATSATTGTRTLSVRAVDEAGNVDPTPATWTWDVDRPPTVAITSGPPAFTRSTTASVWFTVADDLTPRWAVVPHCSVDGGPFTPCAAPVSLSDLAPGPHEVAVRAVDGSGFVGQAAHRWVVDVVAPSAPTLAGPSGVDAHTTATFDLASTDDRSAAEDLRFSCSLDYQPWRTCSSPSTFTALSPGTHRLAVLATDQAGNASPTSVSTWRIDVTAPTARVVEGPVDGTSDITPRFVLGGSDDWSAPTDLAFECALDDAPAEPCPSVVELAELLPGRAHSLDVWAIDQAGNRSAPVRHTWQIAFAVTSPPPPPATTGVAYEHTFTANVPELAPWTTWRVTAGTLPYGMRVWGGVLSGRPTQAGTFGPITVTGTSTLGTVTQTVVLTVTETDSMVGTVRNAVTGAPVAGARVRAYNGVDALAKVVDTDAQGTYRLGYVPPGSYRLMVSDPTGDHVTAWSGAASSLATAAPIAVVDGPPVTADVALTPRSTIGGTVTNQATGRPVAGLWATLYDAAGATLGARVTDATGWFQFRYLAAGSYRLKLSDPAGGYVAEHWRDATTLATATPIPVGSGGLTRTDVAVAPLGTVTGVVTDQHTGTAVVGTWVSMYDTSGRLLGTRATDATGRYTFRSLASGSYHLLIAHPQGGWVREWWRDATSQATATPVAVTGGTTTANAVVRRTASLSGVVTSSTTARPIAGVRVSLLNPDGTGAGLATTGVDGRYQLTNLTPGTYTISFGDPTGAHRAEYWADAPTLAGATTVVAVAGAAVVANAALDPVTALDVLVVADDTGQGIAGARVTLLDATGRSIGLAYADATGRTRFPSLAPGTYRLSLGDPSGAHVAEYWQDATDLAGSAPITAAGGTLSVVASLAPA